MSGVGFKANTSGGATTQASVTLDRRKAVSRAQRAI